MIQIMQLVLIHVLQIDNEYRMLNWLFVTIISFDQPPHCTTILFTGGLYFMTSVFHHW
jgi:hypothetical protein